MKGRSSTVLMTENARLFVWFRVLFNCRFYYPIYTVLFLDLGLSIAEFAGLNVLWAATIVLSEVPSGALADRVGRRKLVVWASWLMVAEMITLCLMKPGHHDWVLGLFVLNRILSGLAEAAASGADEALAYDSLPEENRAAGWPKVMARLSRWSSVGFMVSALSGAFLYDHEAVNGVLAAVGLGSVEKVWTMKIPLVLNLLTAVACVGVVRRMTEPAMPQDDEQAATWAQVRATLGQIRETAAWIWRSEVVLRLVVLGVVFDSIVRLFLTVASNYYRLVEIEERWFGVIGVVVSMLGLVTAGLMERMAVKRTSKFNFAWLAVMVFVGLQGAAAAVPGWWGVALILPLMLAMRFLQFFLSHYLNVAVDSKRRATVLSFRGLTMNLAYGVMTALFALQTRWLQGELGLSGESPRVFAEALTWWPAWFIGTLGVALGWMAWKFRARGGAKG